MRKVLKIREHAREKVEKVLRKKRTCKRKSTKSKFWEKEKKVGETTKK
jgi:hypothetical protein